MKSELEPSPLRVFKHTCGRDRQHRGPGPGADREANVLNIYMEYVEGGSLAGLIKTYGALTEPMAQGPGRRPSPLTGHPSDTHALVQITCRPRTG